MIYLPKRWESCVRTSVRGSWRSECSELRRTVPLHEAVRVVVKDVVGVDRHLLRYRIVVVLAHGAVHAARQLPRVGHLHDVNEALVPLPVDAPVERRHRARDLVVARRDAARAVLVLAVVDALVEVLTAQRLARAGIVQDELLEHVRRAVGPVEARPLLELVDSGITC